MKIQPYSLLIALTPILLTQPAYCFKPGILEKKSQSRKLYKTMETSDRTFFTRTGSDFLEVMPMKKNVLPLGPMNGSLSSKSYTRSELSALLSNTKSKDLLVMDTGFALDEKTKSFLPSLIDFSNGLGFKRVIVLASSLHRLAVFYDSADR